MKTIYSALYILIITLLSGCNVSDNGDLDGLWYMTRLDSIGNYTTRDMRQEKISWSFQSKLMQAIDYKNEDWRQIIMMHFTHQNKTLELFDPFIYNRLEGDIYLPTDSIHIISPYGINSIHNVFKVEKLNSKHLQVSDDKLRIYFEKY